MNEIAAQRSRIDKIINAARTIQDVIVCGICLELLKEPVTIRCGHRFCRSCILRVTNNENSACPFCSRKIRKRSIPTEGNNIFQLLIDRFLTLIQAIKEDSGIDVLEPCIKAKNTKESVPLNDRPSTSKFDQNSNISKGSSSQTNTKASSFQTNQKSSNSKIKSQGSRRNSLTKNQANKNSNRGKNTLHKYLSNNPANVPDQELHSEDKVKSWLNNITSHVDDAGTSDSNNEDGSPFLKKVENFKVPEILDATKVIEDIESPEFDNQPSTSKAKEPELDDSTSTKDEELKFKETQSRIQELEMNARRKKLNQNLPDKTILKTPSSVPAASHSDAYDWRRVKKVGKEMQANTFRSLNISVEKNHSPAAVDDNVPSTSSTINDYKSEQKLLNLHDNFHQREIHKTNNTSMDTTDSHKAENISLSCMDEEQVNNIIGILPAQGDSCILEKTRNISRVSNKEFIPELEQSNPLVRPTIKNYENNADDNLPNSPSIHKLSLKKNLINSDNSKLVSSQPGTPDKINLSENKSPERPKSRLSLRLPPIKGSDQCAKQSRSVVSNNNDAPSLVSHNNFHKQNPSNDRNSTTSYGSRISFKKLGKICKKRKNVPFIKLGKVKPTVISTEYNQEVSSALVIKSNIPVNFEIKSLMVNSNSSKVNSEIPDNKEMKLLSPEKDSQLKYLVIESPHCKRGVSKVIDTTGIVNRSVNIDETIQQNQSHTLMEVDPIPAIDLESHVLMEVDEAVHNVGKHKPDLKKVIKHSNEENIKGNLQSGLTKVSISKNDLNIRKPITTVFEPSASTDNESSEDEKESDHSEINQTSTPVKAKVVEIADEEQDILSITLKESDKFSKNPSSRKTVQNAKPDLTEDKKNIHSEAESDASSKIRHSTLKKRAISSSTLSTTKEKSKCSEVESNTDSDESDAKIQSKSRKASINSTSTSSSIKVKNKVSEAGSNTGSDISKIRRRCRKTSSSTSSTLSSVKQINKISEAEINADADILTSNMRDYSKKASSSSTSTLNTIKKTSKKKRAHSDSSNDDEDLDVTSIIGKWCGNADVQVSKKAKVVPSIDNNLIPNQDKTKLILMEEQEDDDDDIVDVTLVGDENPIESKALQRDSPIDDIISKVKSMKEVELINANKLIAVPSSLMSADLFESNEPYVQPSAQISPKQVNSEVIVDKSEDIDSTLVDLIQTSRKKSNISESSDGSNKENNESNKINSSPIKVGEVSGINEIENSQKSKVTKNLNSSSQADVYQISESLMNITQEQLALKKIEKDLIGIDLSTIHNNKNKVVQDSDKHATPHGKKKQIRNIEEIIADEDSDFENIGATPCAKRSKKSIRDGLPNQLLPKFAVGSQSQINSSEIFSPCKDAIDLIPAITPVKNRNSYPLCHSTPVINTSNPESQSVQSKMVLICSGLQTDQIKTVQTFVKRFNATFQAVFSMNVTHVITSTDPETKIGQRTFKYIQGIAFQKHVLSFQWILDCLEKNRILDEEDEKYEVLDGDVLESGAKKSRYRQQGLFESFAFFCLEPFTALSISEFKNILAFNGAVVVDSLGQLAAQKNKHRIAIVPEDFDLNEKKLNLFKKAQCALVSFDWIVDSISQYHNISIAPYLQETTPEELLALGFPAEYLVEEECGEEDEGDE